MNSGPLRVGPPHPLLFLLTSGTIQISSNSGKLKGYVSHLCIIYKISTPIMGF